MFPLQVRCILCEDYHEQWNQDHEGHRNTLILNWNILKEGVPEGTPSFLFIFVIYDIG